MPTYVSKDGKQYPAREKVVLYDPDGNPRIYEGPDRAAVNYMKEQGLDPEKDHLGMHFSEDTDIIERAHEKKKSVEEFCKTSAPGNKQADREKKFEENMKKVNNHALPKRKPYKQQGQSGGTNFAGGGGHLSGGFGENGDALTDAIASVEKGKK